MEYDAASVNTEIIKANVCIIGSGPAGMTLANSLLDSDLTVVVLESGTKNHSTVTDDLNKGTLSGILNQATHEVRARQVGGTATHWIVKMAENDRNGFRFVPLQERDFESWPISKVDIDPYYQQLHTLFNLGPYAYQDLTRWYGDTAGPQLTTKEVASGIFSFCATEYFTQIIPEKLAKSSKHHLYTNATVSELLVSEDGNKIMAAKVITPNQKVIKVEADTFVLANSGFGVPQLLLNSKSSYYPEGLANNYDVVGRYYIDHSLILHGYFYLNENLYDKLKFYDLRHVNGVSIIGSIGLSQDVKRDHCLQNLEAMLFPKPNARNYAAFKSLEEFAWAVKGSRAMTNTLWRNTKNVLMGLPFLVEIAYQKFFKGMLLMPGLARGGWSKLSVVHLKKRYAILEMMGLTEQRPKPTNRVTLTDQRDALGIPRIAVHMDWDDEDKRSILATEQLLVKGLQACGLGEFHSYANNDPEKIHYHTRTCHHLMGTARMGTDLATSVVDSDCKLHGITNGYIASSAVFPSGGYANPTMTILALALRLSDKIKKNALTI